MGASRPMAMVGWSRRGGTFPCSGLPSSDFGPFLLAKVDPYSQKKIPYYCTMSLSKETILQRAFDLELEIRENRIKIGHHGKRYFVSDYSLAILDTFAMPKTMEQGVKELMQRIKGMPGWIEITSHIIDLYQLGILLTPGQEEPKILSDPGRFDAADVHIRMLNDYRRTASFQAALFETVSPNDVVVDVGTGTGVLAATAALAGAKHVYAIERTPNMPKLARKFFEKNGVADKITIIEGDSTEIELPEKADIMVSEIVGNDPLAENIIPTTNDALQRLLKPGARLIPGGLKVFALPLTMPKNITKKHLFTEEQIKQWKKHYGLDFSNFFETSSRQSYHTLINPFKTRNWQRLASPLLVADINLYCLPPEFWESRNTFEALQSGLLNGILIFFEMNLSKTIDFSIHPDQATPENSWASKIWIPGTPAKLTKGQKVELIYKYNENEKSQFEIKA